MITKATSSLMPTLSATVALSRSICLTDVFSMLKY
ncbi:unnamed protein product [Protopolystoma xenopodis]|uniref:Uncharacterized protein n=1 Tax=Protopolystoma xenopodis TaxID=117903 RepID=A0A3S5B0T9_9PLAT|nr:unnamed protein product [Protopolystoma xenopodis]